MRIESILSSRGRIKVLRVLLDAGELNISEIARKAGLNYATTNNHLEVLERAGLVEEKRFGRIRIYRCREDERIRQLKILIRVWERASPL
ncbi:TPA: ArsR family transcriptional regulator [Candidatus Bathyarchaeota archaeon]|nr:ArsR family transcriptional regulator [Candidatus Bathyarchaeota archaeon]